MSSIRKRIYEMITEIERERREEIRNQRDETIERLNNLIKGNKKQIARKQEFNENKRGNSQTQIQTEKSSQNIHNKKDTMQDPNTMTKDETGNSNDGNSQREQILV